MHSDQKKRGNCTANLLFRELVDRGLALSYGEARRLVRAGRVFVNEGAVTDEAMGVSSLTLIRVARGVEYVLPEGAENCGGQKVNPLDAAEDVISALCCDILQEICTTGRLTPGTYIAVSDLSDGNGALAEMIEECRFGPAVNQKGRL